jgi:hypothetical protein
MSENKEYLTNEDEINLYELWFILWKRRWALLSITMLFLGATVSYTYITPTVYMVNNTLVVKAFIDVSEVKYIIKTLNELSPKQKANELGFSEEDIQYIKGMQVLDIKGIKDKIGIVVYTSNREAGVRLINILPSYILARPYIYEKIETQKDLLQRNRYELKKIIDDPIGSLGIKASQTVIYGPMLDVYSYKEKYNQILADISQIERKQIVILADKTLIPEQPDRTKKNRILLIGALISIIMGLASAFFVEGAMNAKRKYQSKIQVDNAYRK